MGGRLLDGWNVFEGGLVLLFVCTFLCFVLLWGFSKASGSGVD